ncbi:YALI0A14949p [Yarrowia lipolytica CLIB122]|uniref:YALI0A14949p n=2 Tax=Yarrowia lipolytica TaxID=4952 RepID=Q6CGY3_YARLI|nr:YALI0A14949p [Yarrowia lipolytica CLIB122]AOW00663.1 hypothetical protein YALI1_A14999g [Yarrowia lipolytica]KAB8283227.1 hypothetical protein BKA91DRAFT_83573 [Yarrowia lipolytica]RMI95197.1 hypothetical protein BD777DRAFT_143546 [Yarrowia lipolytica]CAG84009.1 YALI0A14949p [Yarrowia lipolytica CLIB122]|eukprot:XP_500079.1 YALI0A14949p [Yarrowia lipolytica CLIB122]
MLEQTTLECVKISKGNHTDQQERRAGSHQRGKSQNLQSKRRRLQHLHRLGLRSQLRQKGCVQYLNWQRNGWTNSRGLHVANQDLIQSILTLRRRNAVEMFAS